MVPLHSHRELKYGPLQLRSRANEPGPPQTDRTHFFSGQQDQAGFWESGHCATAHRLEFTIELAFPKNPPQKLNKTNGTGIYNDFPKMHCNLNELAAGFLSTIVDFYGNFPIIKTIETIRKTF